MAEQVTLVGSLDQATSLRNPAFSGDREDVGVLKMKMMENIFYWFAWLITKRKNNLLHSILQLVKLKSVEIVELKSTIITILNKKQHKIKQ